MFKNSKSIGEGQVTGNVNGVDIKLCHWVPKVPFLSEIERYQTLKVPFQFTTTFTFHYLKLEIAIVELYLARLLRHLPTTTIGICSTCQFLTFSFPLFILAISCTLSFVQFLFNFCEFNRMANVQCAVIFVLWLTVYVTLLQTSIMFTHAEQLWPILQDIRKAGYMPYLLLVPDPNGPLREHHQHPTVQTEFEPAHMDHMKEMVHRWRYKSGICILVNSFMSRFRMGWDTSEGKAIWRGEDSREFEKMREMDRRLDKRLVLCQHHHHHHHDHQCQCCHIPDCTIHHHHTIYAQLGGHVWAVICRWFGERREVNWCLVMDYTTTLNIQDWTRHCRRQLGPQWGHCWGSKQVCE